MKLYSLLLTIPNPYGHPIHSASSHLFSILSSPLMDDLVLRLTKSRSQVTPADSPPDVRHLRRSSNLVSVSFSHIHSLNPIYFILNPIKLDDRYS